MTEYSAKRRGKEEENRRPILNTMHQLRKRRHICGRRFFTQKSMKIYGTDLKYLDNAIDQQQRLAQQMRRRKPKLGTKPQRRGDPRI
ncbi:hypothetical protein PoB_002739500 [Plakobranchus ocellatus]|uniref:Uncharacterized protein n=1 Tax=Plakobranchus ocellatus TaxID=259542 RepID=A0AAV4A0F3_9GAST|nr:hypothetical protein PoB_002739500 [Plakobranchus ocellatus]